MKKAMLFSVVFGLVGLAWAADNPFVGTWKLNVAKSIATPAPKSQILKITAQPGGGFRWAFETIEADGRVTSGVWAGQYDGKDYPLTGNSDFDTVATTEVDANTLDSVMRKQGKVVGNGKEIVSTDGKALTLTSKLTNAQQGVSVYEKQ